MEGVNVEISRYGNWQDLDWDQLPESYLPKKWKTTDINNDGVQDILVPSESKLETIQNLELDQVEREPSFIYDVEETEEGEVDFDSVDLPQEGLELENGDIDFDVFEEMVSESSFEPVSYKVLYGQSDLTSFSASDPLLHGSIFRMERNEQCREGNYKVELEPGTADHVLSSEDGSYDLYHFGLATLSRIQGLGEYNITHVPTAFIRGLELLEADKQSTAHIMSIDDDRQAAL
jgi:hypothetical protein